MVLVLLAVILGILAFVVGRRPPPVSGPQVHAGPSIPTFPVVVAAHALDAGRSIDADGVRVVQLPVQPTGAFARTQDVIGHVPRVAIPSGLPLTENGLNQGLPLTLTSGERGVAIPIDEVAGVGNGVQAGDYVDVFYSARAPGAANGVQGSDRAIARLLLARVRVLAYGVDSLVPSASASGGSPLNRDTMHAQARSAVLAVPLADVAELVLATQSGKLTLALRYPDDKQEPDKDLFASPANVLSTRADLSAVQLAQLKRPENSAYAGVDSLSLVGQTLGDAGRAQPPLPGGTIEDHLPAAAPRAPRSRRAPAPVSDGLIEVIRGGDIKREASDGSSVPLTATPGAPAGVSP